MVVSEKKIFLFKVILNEQDFGLQGGEIYCVERSQSAGWSIESLDFSGKHALFYMILKKSGERSEVKRFGLNGGKMVQAVQTTIRDSFRHLQVCPNNPDWLYFTDKNMVFKLDLGSPLQTTDAVSVQLKKVRQRSRTAGEPVTADGAELFFKMESQEIYFLQFTEDSKYFFTNLGKTLQKYLTEGTKLVESFEEHEGDVRDLLMPMGVPFMFT